MASFSELLNTSEVPVLVDFYADWCGPCKMLAPELQKLATELDGQVKIIKVNVDKSQAAARKYQVQGIPALLLFSQGKIVWRTSGYQNHQQLATQLKPFLKIAAS